MTGETLGRSISTDGILRRSWYGSLGCDREMLIGPRYVSVLERYRAGVSRDRGIEVSILDAAVKRRD